MKTTVNWKDQIEQLQIPYPQKHFLSSEIAEHIVHFPDQSTSVLEPAALEELQSIHNNVLFKALESVSLAARRAVGWAPKED